MNRSSGVTLVSVVVSTVGLLAVVATGYIWWHPLADDFLGNADFEGAPITTSPITSGMQSTYNGVLTITNLDRTLVQAVIPSGFKLAKNNSFWLKTKHPVLLLYGDQTDGAGFIGNVVTPAPVPDRGHYSEIILAIPYVQKVGSSGWHTYIVRMYLDNATAVLGGSAFGYSKQLGCLDWRGAIVKIWQQPLVCTDITRPLGGNLLQGDFRSVGLWYDGPNAYSYIPNLGDMVGMVNTRILGKSATGASICSFFEWSLDDARVAKAKTTHKYLSPFRSSMSAWPGLGDLDNVSDGAVYLRGVRWRLASGPVSCGFP